MLIGWIDYSTDTSTGLYRNIILQLIIMRLLLSSSLVLFAGSSTNAFAPPTQQRTICNSRSVSCSTPLFEAATADAETMADSGKPPESADSDANIDDVEIPTNLPSDVGMDYVPLATMLATGQLVEADQVREYDM